MTDTALPPPYPTPTHGDVTHAPPSSHTFEPETPTPSPPKPAGRLSNGRFTFGTLASHAVHAIGPAARSNSFWKGPQRKSRNT
jgi:hypothetical protein